MDSTIQMNGKSVRLAEQLAIKIKLLGKTPEVKKVFHAAVGHPQRNDRLKLLGYDRLSALRKQAGHVLVQNHRKVDFDRIRRDCVTKPMSI